MGAWSKAVFLVVHVVHGPVTFLMRFFVILCYRTAQNACNLDQTVARFLRVINEDRGPNLTQIGLYLMPLKGPETYASISRDSVGRVQRVVKNCEAF